MVKLVVTVILLIGLIWVIVFYPIPTCIFSLGAIGYIYLIYPLLLGVVGFWRERSKSFEPAERPAVSIIVAAFNEEKNIAKRIHNILASEYPSDKIEILIGSDGSKDETVAEAQSVKDERVRVLDFTSNRGRASVHNDCARDAKGDILVFSDAETEFTPNFLRHITTPFQDPKVGLATGVMELLNKSESGLAVSRGVYWKFEYWMRNLESNAGLLAVASGCCMAIRKKLYRPMPLSTDDIDFVCPLDVVGQGCSCVHVPEAVVYERQFAGERGEFRSRVRMTSRNIYGTWMRLIQYSPLGHPRLWFPVISHKFLRWLTPFFMIASYVCTWINQSNFFMDAAFVIQTACYTAAVLGYILRFFNYEIRFLSSFHSFALANAGFFVGTIKGIWGTRPSTYYRQNEER